MSFTRITRLLLLITFFCACTSLGASDILTQHCVRDGKKKTLLKNMSRFFSITTAILSQSAYYCAFILFNTGGFSYSKIVKTTMPTDTPHGPETESVFLGGEKFGFGVAYFFCLACLLFSGGDAVITLIHMCNWCRSKCHNRHNKREVMYEVNE